MPAVGMRRTTRVFGARVLRSGRRLLMTEPAEVGKPKHHSRAVINLEEEWIDLVDNSEDEAVTIKENARNEDTAVNKEMMNMDIDVNKEEQSETKMNKLWGAVYQRKRKRLNMKAGVGSLRLTGRMYKKLFRTQRIKESQDSVTCQGLAIVVEPSFGSSSFGVFSCFLNSIFRYMRKATLRLQQLSAFLFSDAIACVYSLDGIHFLQDCSSISSSVVCKILESKCSLPMFELHFSAVPLVFMHIHSNLFLRSATLSYALVLYLNGMEVEVGRMTDEKELPPCEEDKTRSKTEVLVDIINSRNSMELELMNAVSSRSFQKQRSSRISRRRRNLLPLIVPKTNGITLSPATSSKKLISPVSENSVSKGKEFKSTMVRLTEDTDTSSCSASILVIGSDKCYREEGATITLESSGNQWFLAINRDSKRRYNLMVQQVMRPCSCNRITNAIIWTDDDGWKLEFPNRIDWLIFKKLYKESSDHNLLAPTVSVIPVPEVVQVSSYGERDGVLFRRPKAYISWKDNELTRAFAKGTANYELDSDGEAWLDKFNNENFLDNEVDKHVSADVFEIIINSFEKGLFCEEDKYSDVGAAVGLCINLERREVLEAVHTYLMNKRKQKKRALSRLIETYKPRKTEVLPKAILRKKRSFKQQPSKAVRGKQRIFFPAQQDAVEKQKAILMVQKAGVKADGLVGVAIHKRKRAQFLMKTADLITHKAAEAIRIAEAAELVGKPKKLRLK